MSKERALEDKITVNPTVGTGGHVANDVVGGVLSFQDADDSQASAYTLQQVMVSDAADQDVAYKMVLFNDNPASSTTADDGALTIHADDMGKVIDIIDIATKESEGGISVAKAKNIGLAVRLRNGTTLFGVLLSQGTPTYTAATDVRVSISIIPS